VAGYAGNPLALKIVAQAVCDLFGGDLDRFLEEGELVFNGVRPVLRQQVGRLSALEHLLLTWLAVLREWTELSALLQVLHPRVLRGQMLEALEALGRRSLLERGQQASFSLQSVVMEYLTDELSERLAEEIVQGDPQQLRRYALEQAQTKDYVREIQVRLLVHPLLERLRAELGGDALVEARLLDLLALFRTEDTAIQGYGPANILSLLKALRGHLRGLDLSRLAIRGVYLQGIEMQDTTLAGSLIQEALFTASFDALNGVAISSTGEYWAASSRRGEVRVWQADGQILYHIWQAHTERAWSLAFSPDGRMLVSGSWDGLVKLWEVETGSLVWSGRHTGIINSVAFAPDGSLLASAGANETILWEVKSGTQAHTLTHPDQVISVAWSPQGQLLATGDVEGRIRLWSVHETEPAICMQTLTAHTKLISELAFAPDGSVLASASYDSTVKLWDVAAGRLDQTLTGHSERIHRVAWSPDGRLLASGGYEKAIWLWDVEQNRYRGTLQGHTDSVLDLAFTPDSRRLLSCGDSTLRLWDIESLRCIRVLQGNVEALFDVDWSPDGTRLASGGSDKLVTIFDATEGTPSRVLRGHGGLVFGVAWSPDGRRLASSSWDTTVRVWNPATGESLQVLGASEDPITFFCGLAWSPDGNLLAGTTYLNLPGVLVWEVRLGSPLWRGSSRVSPGARMGLAWSRQAGAERVQS
jgi:WD40 repeat protein